MKRRSFLQSIGAGIAALFVPTVVARQIAPAKHAYLTDPDAWHLIDYPHGNIIWFSPKGVMSYDGKSLKTLSEAIDAT